MTESVTQDDGSSGARPELAPWAIRIAAQAPPLTPEQIARIRAFFADARADMRLEREPDQALSRSAEHAKTPSPSPGTDRVTERA
jgi:hypothetical protein